MLNKIYVLKLKLYISKIPTTIIKINKSLKLFLALKNFVNIKISTTNKIIISHPIVVKLSRFSKSNEMSECITKMCEHLINNPHINALTIVLRIVIFDLKDKMFKNKKCKNKSASEGVN